VRLMSSKTARTSGEASLYSTGVRDGMAFGLRSLSQLGGKLRHDSAIRADAVKAWSKKRPPPDLIRGRLSNFRQNT
jgi:hypothetical protein